MYDSDSVKQEMSHVLDNFQEYQNSQVNVKC